jgi:hypothetical protein
MEVLERQRRRLAIRRGISTRDRLGEAEQGGGVGEDVDDVAAALISLFTRWSALSTRSSSNTRRGTA